ncbi:helix-turn-helix domain-containing protein [Mangrovimonas sp. AS39]|uniref:helix-turn-helix domain-containing protein n=1 Tax=Mangrovimonas futianensis TaxID=2895523 RepID=UPI001E3B5877|nr:helix-turn-helix domain-containing protein [Mangrovimonas futianensis]MCF1192959.1 helix-turn-helix domain-containing protein [Mangrovimonas futianensis]MCF1196650.1 helix-turn-helix domain-containing protein [Mangrovimonas futianensis]MCF1421575.1 helix-turn-helix domain-containing protein [Mangrovimonas futianensis]
MNSQKIILSQLSSDQLEKLVEGVVRSQLHDFGKSIFIPNSQDELLTREEASKFLKIDQSTLYHWTNKGKVKAYAIGARRYYKKAELIECLTPIYSSNEK